MTDTERRLAAVLDRHQYGIEQTGPGLCTCGWPESRRGLGELNEAHRTHLAAALLPVVAEIEAEARAGALREAADERAAKRVAADSADRFRDVLSECLGHEDENPGDDVLVAELREHFGRTGPEPTRWREFVTGARAAVDQINADRADSIARTAEGDE